MRKLFLTAAAMLTVGILLLGSTAAQQTPASNPKPATAAKPSTTAKPHTATTAKTTQPLTLTTQKDKLSHAIGMNIGQGMKKDSLDIDPSILARGFKDAMAGGKLLMTDEEAKAVMTEFRTAMMKKKEAEAQHISETNKQAETHQNCPTHGPQEKRDWDSANTMGTSDAYIAFRAKYPTTQCVRILSGEVSSSLGLEESRLVGSVSVNGEMVAGPVDVDELVRLGLANQGGGSVSVKTLPNAFCFGEPNPSSET